MEKMQELEQEENRIEEIITHDGLFHTDEVFAISILKDIFPESMELKAGGKVDFIKYIRTRDNSVINKGVKTQKSLMVDVGLNNSEELNNNDHHQKEGGGKRENGIEYASAGLIWKTFGKEWIKYVDVYNRKANLTEAEIESIWKLMDQHYVQLIDANDTGQLEDTSFVLNNGTQLPGKTFNFAEIVRLYNIDTYDGKDQNERFLEVTEVMRRVILGAVHKYIDLVEDLRTLETADYSFLENQKVAIFEKNIKPATASYIVDTFDSFKNVEFYAVKNPNGYSIMVAPIKEGLRQYRNPNMIPAEMRLGKNQKEVNKILGIETGVFFVHTAGFYASCKDYTSTKKFLEYCIKK